MKIVVIVDSDGVIREAVGPFKDENEVRNYVSNNKMSGMLADLKKPIINQLKPVDEGLVNMYSDILMPICREAINSTSMIKALILTAARIAHKSVDREDDPRIQSITDGLFGELIEKTLKPTVETADDVLYAIGRYHRAVVTEAIAEKIWPTFGQRAAWLAENNLTATYDERLQSYIIR